MRADQLDRLLGAISAAPALPGARCRGKAHLFDEAGKHEDPETADQRHTQALGLCRGCTALASCQQWYTALPRSKRPPGVVAGQINQPRHPGRPRKETAL